MDHVHALIHHVVSFLGRLLGRKILESYLGHAVRIGELLLESHPILRDTLLHTEEPGKWNIQIE